MNLNFLAPIDITTIFGNLLDNAIEAAEKLEGEKYISIKIGSYHKMIAASIEITAEKCSEQCKKYDGNLILKVRK